LVHLLRGVVDALPVALSVKDRDLRFVLVNDYFCAFHGTDAEDVLGRTAGGYSTGEALELIDAGDRQVLATAGPSGLWETDEIDHAGNVRRWLIGKWPLADAASGEVGHIVTMAFDISDLHASRRIAEERGLQLAAVTSRSPVMLLKTVHSPDGSATMPFVTGLVADELGLDREALARDAHAILKHIHPDDRDRVLEVWEHSVATLKPYTTEFRMLGADGGLRWVSARATHHIEDDGTMVSSEVLIDITGLHEARQAAEEHRLQVEAITSRAPVMLAERVQRPDGTYRIPFVSGRIAEELGLDTASLARDGSGTMVNVHPDDRERIRALWQHSLTTLQPYTAEFRLIAHDGKERWVNSRATHRRDDDGTIHSTEVVVDISELQAVREQAQERQHQLDSLARNVPGAIARVLTRPDGTTVIPYLSENFAVRMGIDVEEAARDGGALWRRVHPDDQETVDRQWAQSLESLQPFDSTFRFVTPDGEVLWYRSISVHHKQESGTIVSDTLTIDVTDEKQAALELQHERETHRSVTDHIRGVLYRRVDLPDGTRRYDYIEGGLLGILQIDAEAVKRNPDVLWGPFDLDDQEMTPAMIAEKVRELQPYSFVLRCRPPGATEDLHIEMSATPRRMDDGTIVTDGIALDVTPRVLAETGARAQRTLLQQVIDAMPAAINVKDREGRIELANRTLADYYGVAPEDMLGETSASIEDSPEEDAETQAWDRVVFESGEISSAREQNFVDAMGHRSYWLGRKSPLFNPLTGEVDRVVTVSLNITDRIAAEHRADDVQVRLDSIAENLPGMILRRIHHPDGTITYPYAAGRMAAEIGISPEGTAKPRAWDMMVSEDRERMIGDLKRMVETMEPLEVLNRYIADDGSLQWVRNISQPRRLDDGTIVSDAILLNVTDRVSAEERAREHVELLRSVAANIPGAVLRWRVSADHIVNQEFAAGSFVEAGLIDGARTSGTLAQIWPGLVAPDLHKLTTALHAPANGRGIELELRMRVNDETRWIKLFGNRRAGPEGQSAWDVIVMDATESKRYEEQLRIAQKMDAIGNLTGGIAHDFNNILAVIVANLDLLLDLAPLEKESRQVADAALHAAERGAELTNRLLAFARNQPTEPGTFDCDERIDSFVGFIRRSLGAEINLDLRRSPERVVVNVDPGQFENALMNLVVNARDAMDGRGTIVIENNVVNLSPLDQSPAELKPGSYAVISITDAGAGMSPEVQRRAFEPLFTTKSQGRGTGFGLPMVYNFAKQAGGIVTLYSEPGHGTTARLYLPVHLGDDSIDPALQEAAAGPALMPEGDVRILLVDDNSEARTALASQLKRHGLTIMEAHNASQALAIAEYEEKIDLLITDVIMPGTMNGAELADRLHESRPGLPILLITGYSSRALAEREMTRGHYEMLGKPFRERELMAVVARLLGGGER